MAREGVEVIQFFIAGMAAAAAAAVGGTATAEGDPGCALEEPEDGFVNAVATTRSKEWAMLHSAATRHLDCSSLRMNVLMALSRVSSMRNTFTFEISFPSADSLRAPVIKNIRWCTADSERLTELDVASEGNA